MPCYNEEQSLKYLVQELVAIQEKLINKYNLKILLVNDGSSDRTQEKIEYYTKEYDFIGYVLFAFNSGHQAALRAGIEASLDSDAVIMLDADLQHPPSYIPEILNEWELSGANIVQMLRRDTMKEAGAFKYLTSKMYYRVINMLSDLKLEYGASDFRLIDASVAHAVANSRENDLFLRGYFSWLKVSRTTLDYKPSKRVAGKSKYTLKKMIRLASKGILQFSERPLRLGMSLGIIMACISVIYGLITIFHYLSGDYVVSGWTSLMVIMLFCFGVTFFLLGLIGTYIAHLISISKERPEYIIRKTNL